MKNRTAKNIANIVILQGSPNAKGNTAALADAIAAGASAAGAKVRTFFLHKMKIASCASCNRCQKPRAKGCVIHDDMDKIYPAIKDADAIVLASPIYWFTISAQLKQAIDRFYALGSPEGYSFAGKRIGLAFTYLGDDVFDSGCINAIRTFQDMFNYVKAPIAGMVYGSSAAGHVKITNKPLMRKARDLGRTLANG